MGALLTLVVGLWAAITVLSLVALFRRYMAVSGSDVKENRGIAEEFVDVLM